MDARTNLDVTMTDAQMGSDNGQNKSTSSRVLLSYPPILDMPLDLQKEVYTHCCLPKVLGLFAQVSRQSEQRTAFLRLQLSAVNAEPESYKQADETKLAAIAILKRHPELLFQSGRVDDHFKRTIEASIYRLLLGAGDVWALKQIHEVIIPLIKDGKALAAAAFKAQFPNCPWPPQPDMPKKVLPEEVLYDDRNKAQIAAVKALLTVIVATISADPCTKGKATLNETKQAVAALCQIFTPKAAEVIRTGLHFPLGIMQEIFKVYDAQPGAWDANRFAYFSRTVIGSAEAALTAVDGQCYKYGLVGLNFTKGPDRRDGLFCRRPLGLPSTLTPLAGSLGNTGFVDPFNGESCFITSFISSKIISSNLGSFDWYTKKGRFGHGYAGWARCSYSVLDCARLGAVYAEQKQKLFGVIMRQHAEKLTRCLVEHGRSRQCVMF